ncbi:MAG TPA: c-type cytochrome [Anaeromyxobacteraceae bacterium]|nr:c-type cytochrome [Anaeromyxobacteraceae bacterium]
MTGGRGPAFLLGALAALAAAAVAGALIAATGAVDVAATVPHPLADRVLGWASTRAVARHAPQQPNPLAGDPAALRRGLDHYRAMCIGCHGGPGAEPEEFAGGLHPPAPDLASPAIQSFSDGMIYDVVDRGIGSTGMPAFGKTHRPEDLWSIVAFVRHLPRLTPEEKAALAGGGGSHGGDGEREHAAGGEQGQAGHAVHKVTISGFKFDPPTVEVHAGDVVEWKNADFASHSATADDHSFDTGAIAAGATKQVVAKAKGRFGYFCRYHQAMKATLVVQ